MVLLKTKSVGFLVLALAFGAAGEIRPAQAQDASAGSAWTTRCVSSSWDAPEICTASHNVVVEETGQLFLKVAFEHRFSSDDVVMNLTVPLGLYLPAGLTVSVDERQLAVVEIAMCDANNCRAATSVTRDTLTQMQGAQALEVELSANANATRSVPVPTKGLSQALTRIGLDG